MGKTPDEIKRGLGDAISVHYHAGDREAHLSPLAMHRLEALHANALVYIQQLETENHQLLTKAEQLQRERDTALGQLNGHCWCCKKGKPLREGSGMMICPHFGALQGIVGTIRSDCPHWEWNAGKENGE